MDKIEATHKEEEVLVLYGSETGESQDAAERIAKNMTLCLSPEAVCLLTDYDDGGEEDGELPHVRARLDTLDNFLRKGAQWTRNVVIVVSSALEGSAPANSVQFRKLCDMVVKKSQTCKVLEGIHYHILGLGDSSYSTFLKNPKRLDSALRRLGATRVGDLGVADANRSSQSAEVRKWIKALWLPLAHGIVDRGNLTKKDLEKCSAEFTNLHEQVMTKKKPKSWPTDPGPASSRV